MEHMCALNDECQGSPAIDSGGSNQKREAAKPFRGRTCH